MPGNYRVQAGGDEQGIDLGFSVNLPTQVSDLARVGDEDLKAVFGDTTFRLARNRDEIDRSVNAGRVGQELFPYLIVLLVLILALEQVLANRFYQDYDTAAPTSRAAQLAGHSSPAPNNASPDSGGGPMSEWYFHPVGGYWLVSAAALVLVLLLTLFGLPRKRLTPRRRAILATFRVAVLVLAMFAMLRPTLVQSTTKRRSATLVVLVDRSRSMQVADAVGGQIALGDAAGHDRRRVADAALDSAKTWKSRSMPSTTWCSRSTFRKARSTWASCPTASRPRSARRSTTSCVARPASDWQA